MLRKFKFLKLKNVVNLHLCSGRVLELNQPKYEESKLHIIVYSDLHRE